MSFSWLHGVQLMIFFRSSIPVVLLDSPGISKCLNTLFLLSPRFDCQDLSLINLHCIVLLKLYRNLGKFSRREIIDTFLSHFPENGIRLFMQIVSCGHRLYETSILLSGKKNKNSISKCLLKFLPAGKALN